MKVKMFFQGSGPIAELEKRVNIFLASLEEQGQEVCFVTQSESQSQGASNINDVYSLTVSIWSKAKSAA
jgi:hypothetical protein